MSPALRTSGIHLLAGTLLAAAVLLPMLVVWYPQPLFDAAGTGRLPVFEALLATVPGPFLFRSRRRLIAGIQAAVLAGCALALYVQRPVYLVFTVDRFELVLAKDIHPADLAKASREEFRRRPLGSPQYVAVLPPGDPVEVQRILVAALDGGKDLQAYPQYYVPYAQEARNALRRANSVDTILGKNPGAIETYAAAAGRSLASMKFLPLRAKKRDCIVLIDAASGLPLAILPVDPW